MRDGLPVWASYDEIGDVLYLATDNQRTDVRYREDDDGLLLRVSSDGVVIGVTVEDFAYVWCKRTDELAHLAADRLHVDYGVIRDCVQANCVNIH